MLVGKIPAHKFIVVISCVLISILSACSDQPIAVPLQPPAKNAILASVTPEVAARLAPDGSFAVQTTGEADEINADRAKELAAVWANNFASRAAHWLEKTRGAPINYKALKPCGRALYAQSAFERLPADVPAASRRMWGAWWLVTLCAGTESQVSLAVSAAATELTIEHGKLNFPFASGNEFFPVGIPVGQIGEYPESPETAAEGIARRHGRLVSRVPNLVMPVHTNGIPQMARWQVHLDSKAAVKLLKDSILVDEVYSGRAGVGVINDVKEFVPTDTQPDEFAFFFAPEPRSGESARAYNQRLGSRISRTIAVRQPLIPLSFQVVREGGAN